MINPVGGTISFKGPFLLSVTAVSDPEFPDENYLGKQELCTYGIRDYDRKSRNGKYC